MITNAIKNTGMPTTTKYSSLKKSEISCKAGLYVLCIIGGLAFDNEGIPG